MDHNSPSLLLVFDKARFIFNAGEGLQRLMREKKIKMTKVRMAGALVKVLEHCPPQSDPDSPSFVL